MRRYVLFGPVQVNEKTRINCAGNRSAGSLRSAILVFGIVILSTSSAAFLTATIADRGSERLVYESVPSNAPFDHVVTVMMENHGYCDVMTTCGGSFPFMTQHAQQWSIAGTCSSDVSCSIGGYTAISHPSQPNYIALAAGDTLVSGDGNCCFQLSNRNIVDLIESGGLTWQAFAEDATGSGTCNFMPPRQADHFPFLEFSDMNKTARCSHFQTTTSSSDPEFVASLNSASPANFIWLTPNDNDNGDNGDAYLSSLVPKILSSTLFTTSKAALFIVYDEGPHTSISPTDFVYASWSGPVVKNHYVGTGSYSHYSWAKTIETAWGLGPCMMNDCKATPMTEFFTSLHSPPLYATIAYSPASPVVGQTVTFTATAGGGKPPYSFSWNFGDGSPIVAGNPATHAYTATGSPTATVTAKDSVGATASASISVTVNAPIKDNTSTSVPYVSCQMLVGQTSCTATVTVTVADATASGSTPSGTVTFGLTFNRGSLSAPNCTLSAGSCSVTFTGTMVGTGSLVASYNGDSAHSSSSATTNLTVAAQGVDNSSTAVSCAPTSIPIGGTSTCTATVADTTTPANTATGTVSFTSSNTTVGTVGGSCTLSSGSCTVTFTSVESGSATVNGSYSGDTSHNGSSDTSTSIAVQAVPITISADFTMTAATTGQPTTFTATVSGGTPPYNLTWSFGDGQIVTGASQSVVHTYTAAGPYTVTLNVTEPGSSAGMARATHTVSVSTPTTQPTGNLPGTNLPLNWVLVGAIAVGLLFVGFVMSRVARRAPRRTRSRRT